MCAGGARCGVRRSSRPFTTTARKEQTGCMILYDEHEIAVAVSLQNAGTRTHRRWTVTNLLSRFPGCLRSRSMLSLILQLLAACHPALPEPFAAATHNPRCAQENAQNIVATTVPRWRPERTEGCVTACVLNRSVASGGTGSPASLQYVQSEPASLFVTDQQCRCSPRAS